MSAMAYDLLWQALPNPFSKVKQVPSASSSSQGDNEADTVIGQISGRSADIIDIITGKQSAIILTGAPHIGKSAFIRYLQQSPEAKWSWRDDLAVLRQQLKLDDIYFVQVDLTALKGIEKVDELLNPFIEQCIIALQSAYKHHKQQFSRDRKGLRELLRNINSKGRTILLLDTIDRLGESGLRSFNLVSEAQTPQDRGIALLDHSGALRVLVDLIDEFTTFGVILSIESLPAPRISDQFTHVSADLARFTTMTLQAFTWDAAGKFVAQEPESFGTDWAGRFRELTKCPIFSKDEQAWLLEQAGTHPYLLQQFCFHTFHFKQQYACRYKVWSEMQDDDKKHIIEKINGSLSFFLAHIWQRVQEALKKSSEETQNNFYTFVKLLAEKRAEEILEPAYWETLGYELRYILSSEGIIRYDPFQPIHFPGTTLRHYLIRKIREHSSSEDSVPHRAASSITRGFWLNISRPGYQQDRLPLSELEYHLLKTLIQHPGRCTEEELMKGAWGKVIQRPTFTQRMHHLRKKLKDRCGGTEVIENRYGGQYSLSHPEWLHLAS